MGGGSWGDLLNWRGVLSGTDVENALPPGPNSTEPYNKYPKIEVAIDPDNPSLGTKTLPSQVLTQNK